MYPSLKEVIDLAGSGQYRRIPVCREIYSDFLTPVEAMRILKNASHHCFMLESAEDSKRWGRYTFLGYDPTAEITCAEGNLRVRYGEHVVEKKGDPQQEIRRILSENRGPRLENMPPFTGGLVGFFSYEYIRYMEPGLNISCEDQDFQDVDLMLFDQVIAFDNFRQKLVMIAGVRAENPEKSYKEAEEKLKTLELLLRTGHKADPQPIHLKNPCSPDFSEAEYCGMVEKAKHYIREGDIFQVVLSNPLEAEAEGSLFDIYRTLRASNPSPYMFYFSSDSIEIAGASPETLVTVSYTHLLFLEIMCLCHAAFGSAGQAPGSHDSKVGGRGHRAERLIRTDIGTGFFPPDVLFSGLQRQDKSPFSVYICSLAHDPSGKPAHQLLSGSHESKIWAAEGKRHSQRLSFPCLLYTSHSGCSPLRLPQFLS